MAFGGLSLALAVITLGRSFLYLVTLVLSSVQRFVYSRFTYHLSWKVFFLVSHVKNGSAVRCTYETVPYSLYKGACTTTTVSRTANPRFRTAVVDFSGDGVV